MGIHSTNRSVLSLILAGALIAILNLSACDEDSPISCPVYEIGAIEGYVLVSGQGESVQIGARALENPNRGVVLCSTISDTTGWYRLDLPTGLYRMEIDPSHATVISSDMRDTIRVTPSVHRFDLARGRAEIRIGLPDELQDRRFTLRLYGQWFDREHLDATVQDGLLQFIGPALQPGT